MEIKTFLLTLYPGEANKICRWCQEQFGEEFLHWKYVYGGGYAYVNGNMDQTFIIKGIENIVLFELTWGEYKSSRDPFY